jgi:hypothetical protein
MFTSPSGVSSFSFLDVMGRQQVSGPSSVQRKRLFSSVSQTGCTRRDLKNVATQERFF